MKDSKRALRRHHRQRMIARARRIYLSRHIDAFYPSMQKWTVRRYNNLQSCSCYMCGHRRKWNGPTTQERRQNQRPRYAEE